LKLLNDRQLNINGVSVVTCKGERDYLHVLKYVSDSVTLRDVPQNITKAIVLKDGSPVKLVRRGENTVLTIRPQQRDQADTVIRLEK
jgi:hypothetical protein